MPFPIGALIGAAGSVLGSVLSKGSSEGSARANRQNIKFQKQTNRQNREAQEKVNKNQIQWLVEDARKAGISPLAALGSSAAGSIVAPTSVAPSVSSPASSGSSVGDGIARGASILGGGIDTWLQRENLALQNQALSIANARSRSMIADAKAATSDAPTLTAMGFNIKRDPKVSSKNTLLQDEYGEVADIPGAIAFGDALKRSMITHHRAALGIQDGENVLDAIRRVLSAYSVQLQRPQSMTPPPGKGRK